MTNALRMPLAEWVFRMSEHNVPAPARVLAIYAAVFDVTGNDELSTLTGLSGRTYDKWKKFLVDAGWVVISRRKGGRGLGIEVSPAVRETPVNFTDVSPRNPCKFYPRKDEQTPAGITPVIDETPVTSAGVSKESFPHTPFKENNNINNLASVGDNSPREAGQLAILNGAKALMVEQLGAWLSPYAPDTVTAERWLVTATTLHGGPVVKEAFAELQAQIASGDLVGRPIVVLNKICERIKKRPAQVRGSKAPSRDDALRMINAITGGKQ